MTSIIALLVALGLGMVLFAVWLYKTTRPDPELLSPLEVMGERRWRRGDPVWQRRRLDELRPEGADPLEPSVAPPDIDEAFDRGPAASGFDDLHDRSDRGDVSSSTALETDEAARSAVSDPALQRTTSISGDSPLEVPTPQGLQRPAIDDLPAGDIDPGMLAEAIAELDAELGGGQSVDGSAPAD